jgi:hypothetical protein
MKPSGYNFQSPLLICETELECLEPKYWSSGETWIEALAGRTALKGIAMPLELKGEGIHRQQLLGVDLLNWLRWSGGETFRYVPVMTSGASSSRSDPHKY